MDEVDPEVLAMFDKLGVPYRWSESPSGFGRQAFVQDPNGVTIELTEPGMPRTAPGRGRSIACSDTLSFFPKSTSTRAAAAGAGVSNKKSRGSWKEGYRGAPLPFSLH